MHHWRLALCIASFCYFLIDNCLLQKEVHLGLLILENIDECAVVPSRLNQVVVVGLINICIVINEL